ncbi:hypothetical protein AGMMS49936_04240 [Endomicrobiia bacterium]|nr:hypothetical protein AGMMS49936_04240 [Endomicrobiia bacterium]
MYVFLDFTVLKHKALATFSVLTASAMRGGYELCAFCIFNVSLWQMTTLFEQYSYVKDLPTARIFKTLIGVR